MIISGKTLSAAEVAEAFGVDQDTILDWETTDKKFPKRSVGSNANIGVWTTAEIAKYAMKKVESFVFWGGHVQGSLSWSLYL